MTMRHLHEILVPEMREHGTPSCSGSSHEDHPDGPQDAAPIIGIPLPVWQGTQGPLLLADALGAWAIERMGGRIFLIPLWPFPTHPHVYQSLWNLMQSMDGLFLPGGVQGVEEQLPELSSELEAGPHGWALSWEMALAQLATALGLPILAVAQGAHLWNRALGGKDRALLKASGALALHPLPSWERQRIQVRAHSTLASLLQPALVSQDGEPSPWELVFQAKPEVERLAPGLRACAQTEEERVAAFERRDGSFGLGVIGRLEQGVDQVYGMTLFEAFLHACRAFDRWRQDHADWGTARDVLCATLYERVTQGRPILPLSQAAQDGHSPRSHRLSAPQPDALPTSEEPGGQERFRPRAHPLTKAELNRIRRQRWKTATPRKTALRASDGKGKAS